MAAGGSISIIIDLKGAKLSAKAQRLAELATEKAAFDIEGHAKTMAPVDTGFLMSSIVASGAGLGWRVDAGAHYAIYQEFGTRHMAARPFFIPAIETVRPTYIAAMAKIAAL